MYLQLASICLFIHTTAGISVASTSSPYTNPVTEPNYVSPSTAEPSADYKVPNQYPYSRQFFEPLFTPNNQYAESLTSPSPVTGKQFLLHRFFPSLSSPYNQQPSPYEQSNAFGQPPWGTSGYVRPSPYEQSNTFGQPPWGTSGYVRPSPYEQSNTFGQPPWGVSGYFANPDCDFHPSPLFRNTKPQLFYPNKPDPFLDSRILAKPSNSLFRYQPPPYGANYANNIYH